MWFKRLFGRIIKNQNDGGLDSALPKHIPLEPKMWGYLKHGRGTAINVPGLIRMIGEQDPSIKKRALENLFGDIFHQGTRYTATPYAVPYLGELLEDAQRQDKDEIIHMLVNIAIGYDDVYLPKGVDPRQFRENLITAQTNLSDEQRANYEKYGVGPGVDLDCYNAVQFEVPNFFICLTDGNVVTRRAAAYALAWFPDEAERAIPILKSHLAKEPGAVNVATAIISIGMLATNSVESFDVDYLIEYLDHDSALIQTSAAMAMANQDNRSQSKEFDILINALQASSQLREIGQNIPFNEGRFIGLVCLMLSYNYPNRKEIIVPVLCKVMESANSFETLSIVNALLWLTFDRDLSLGQEIDFSFLNKRQSQALKAIFNHSEGQPLNYWRILQDYGLPHTRSELEALLSQTDDGS